LETGGHHPQDKTALIVIRVEDPDRAIEIMQKGCFNVRGNKDTQGS
jgi:hypothetical protein